VERGEGGEDLCSFAVRAVPLGGEAVDVALLVEELLSDADVIRVLGHGWSFVVSGMSNGLTW
jgi:hypothetical protein